MSLPQVRTPKAVRLDQPAETPPRATPAPAEVVAVPVQVPTWKLRWTVSATLIAAGLATLALGLVWYRQVALMLFGGIVLATALKPIIAFLATRCRIGRVYAAILVYGVMTLAVVGMVAAFVPEVIAQGQSLGEKLPGWYDQGREFLRASNNRALHTFGGQLPREMPSLDRLRKFTEGFSDGETSPLGIVSQAAVGVLGVMALGVLAFYWSVNEEQTIRSVVLLAPVHRQPFYESLADELLEKLGGYVRGQLILCAAVGVLSLIAYLLIGLPYALLLAFVACVLEAVPIIGPTLGAVPAVLVALSLGPQQTALVIGAAMLIQTLENYLLVPKIMDSSVGIGAVVTLLAIVAFGAMFGLIGAIFAIPLAAISQTLFEKFVFQADLKSQTVVRRRDSAGVLRYQLLDLLGDVKRQQRQKDTPVDNWTTESYAEIETIASALDQMILEDGADDATSGQPVKATAVTP